MGDFNRDIDRSHKRDLGSQPIADAMPACEPGFRRRGLPRIGCQQVECLSGIAHNLLLSFLFERRQALVRSAQWAAGWFSISRPNGISGPTAMYS